MITFEKNEARADLFTHASDEMHTLITSAATKTPARHGGAAVAVPPPSWGPITRRLVTNSRDVVFLVSVLAGHLAGTAMAMAGAHVLLVAAVAALVATVDALVARAVSSALRNRLVLLDDPTALAVWSVLEDALRITGKGRSPLAAAMHTELAHLERVARGDLEHLGRLTNGDVLDTAARERVLEDLAELGVLSLAATWHLRSPVGSRAGELHAPQGWRRRRQGRAHRAHLNGCSLTEPRRPSPASGDGRRSSCTSVLSTRGDEPGGRYLPPRSNPYRQRYGFDMPARGRTGWSFRW